MDSLFEAKLTTLSPVYIGCEENMSPYSDYIYRNGKVHFIDENKLIKFFMKNKNMDKVMDDYIDIIRIQANSSIQDKYNLESFFQKYALELDEFISYSLDANAKITQNIKKTINSSGRPYIPGSSLKGAIRTCLLYHHLKEESINAKKKRTYIGQDIFGNFANDKLKYLLISDTNTVKNTQCEILRVGRYNLKKESQDVPIIIEAIKTGISFEFSIKLKGDFDSRFRYLNKENINDLLDIINEFYMKSISREIKVLEKNKNQEIYTIINFYQELYKKIKVLKEDKNGAIIRIGGGKTYFDNTILLALDENERDKIIIAGNANKKIKRDKEFFPKTRSVTVDNEQYNKVLGWVRIDLK